MPVSFPEKTYEHWISQYITYRYRSHARLWWPTFGNDVHIGSIPKYPGKYINLEIKTGTWNNNKHQIKIDLAQLNKYIKKPLEQQPFYVFPKPLWSGQLHEPTAHSWLRGRHHSELAFSRTEDKWFANWTHVMTTQEVADLLSVQRKKLSKADNGKTAVLFSVNSKGNFTFAKNELETEPMLWQEFWTKIDTCGYAFWPQTLMARSDKLRGKTTLTRAQALEAVRQSQIENEDYSDVALDFLLPGENGETYDVVDKGTYQYVDDDEHVSTNSHRIFVHIEANALNLDHHV